MADSSQKQKSSQETPTSTGESDDRRNFVAQVLALIVGAVVSLVPLVIGIISFFDPFRTKKAPERYRKEGAAADDEFIYVTTLETLPTDGTPARFVVIADKIDAWNFIPDQPIGSVYLSRHPVEDDTVLAFNTTCPHAGCSVSYEAQSSAFLCPCHNSSFNTNGSRRDTAKENPSPRDLDELDVNAGRLAESGEVWVRYKSYYTGREHKVEKP